MWVPGICPPPPFSSQNAWYLRNSYSLWWHQLGIHWWAYPHSIHLILGLISRISLRFPPFNHVHLSHSMRFPTMWYVGSAKAQTSLRLCAVWSEPLLVAWIFYDSQPTVWTSFGVSKLIRRLHKLVWIYTCQNVTLLELIYTSLLLLNLWNIFIDINNGGNSVSFRALLGFR